MSTFDGFIGSKVLEATKWTIVNDVTPTSGNIFTCSLTMLYSPGFKTRPLAEAPKTEYEYDDVTKTQVMVNGPDDDNIVYCAPVPGNIVIENLSAIQPYLNTARYALAAGAVRTMGGIILPANWKIIAWASKPDLSISIFGVEGRATPYRSSKV